VTDKPNDTCPICQQDIAEARGWINAGLIVHQIDCRNCGRFRYLLDRGPDFNDRRLMPYLAAHVRQANAAGALVVELTPTNWRLFAEGHAHTRVTRKIERLLAWYERASTHAGEAVILPDHLAPLIDAANQDEVDFCNQALIGQELLQDAGAADTFRITAKGWEKLSPAAGGTPGTCVVAMAFDPSLDEAFDLGITPAMAACGLEPIRVDRVKHNEVVTDLILGDIRRAHVTFADVTLQRQGVYYEAGFAIGLGRLVIWSCREDDLPNVHFDTRQFNHVVWKNSTDLRQRLEARIRGTVQIPMTT
jgi:hypothetical protein